MPRKAAHPNPRGPREIDLNRLYALWNDQELLTTALMGDELGLTSRHAVHRLWAPTRSYLDGTSSSWPPGGDGGQGGQVHWWPPHHSALPPPDIYGEQPRWKVGNLRRWAMQTGRMEVDGTPVRSPTSGGITVRPPQEVAPVDAALVEQIAAATSDPTPWTTAEIAEAVGVWPTLVALWQRRTHNRLERGVQSWPPGEAEITIMEGPLRMATWWPPHPGVLPPPDEYRDRPSGGRPTAVWYRGTVWKWALQTGRCRVLDGVLTMRNTNNEGKS